MAWFICREAAKGCKNAIEARSNQVIGFAGGI
jgi:hypothetical protein